MSRNRTEIVDVYRYVLRDSDRAVVGPASAPDPRPGSGQLDALLTIARRAEPAQVHPEPVSARRALTVLARAARPELAVPVLVEVAADPEAPRTERVSALRELGRIGDDLARSGLLDLVRDLDPRIQQEALAGLGQCGTPTLSAG